MLALGNCGHILLVGRKLYLQGLYLVIILVEGLSLLVKLIVQLLEDFVTVGGLLAIYDDGELDLQYKGIASLFHPALVNLLLLQGSLDTVNDIGNGALVSVI